MSAKKSKLSGLEPAVYTAQDMMLLLSMTEWMVYERTKCGDIPGAIKVGASYRYQKSVVNSWLGLPDPGADQKAS